MAVLFEVLPVVGSGAVNPLKRLDEIETVYATHALSSGSVSPTARWQLVWRDPETTIDVLVKLRNRGARDCEFISGSQAPETGAFPILLEQGELRRLTLNPGERLWIKSHEEHRL